MLPENTSNTDYAALPTAQNIKTDKKVNRINLHDTLAEGNMETSGISSQKFLEVCTINTENGIFCVSVIKTKVWLVGS